MGGWLRLRPLGGLQAPAAPGPHPHPHRPDPGGRPHGQGPAHGPARRAHLVVEHTGDTRPRVRRTPGDGHGGRAVRPLGRLPDPQGHGRRLRRGVHGELLRGRGGRTRPGAVRTERRSYESGRHLGRPSNGSNRHPRPPTKGKFRKDRTAPHPPRRPRPPRPPRPAPHHRLRPPPGPRDGQRLLRLPPPPAAPGRAGPLVRAAAPRHGGRVPPPGRPPRPPRGPYRPLAGVPGLPRRSAPRVRPAPHLLARNGTAVRRPPPARRLLRGDGRRTDGRGLGKRARGTALVRTGPRPDRPGPGPFRLLARLRRGVDGMGRPHGAHGVDAGTDTLRPVRPPPPPHPHSPHTPTAPTAPSEGLA